MAIPFVKANEAIRIRPINDLVKQANLSTFADGSPFPAITQAGLLTLAVNKTDDDLKFGDCASIILDNATPIREQPTQLEALGTIIRLRTPTADDKGSFVIAAQAIPKDQSGFVYVSGIILARLQTVTGSDEAFDFCDVDIEAGGKPAVLKMQADGISQVLDVIAESNEADTDWALIKWPVQNLSGSSENPYLVGKDAYEPGQPTYEDEPEDAGEWDREWAKPIQQEGEDTNGMQLTIMTRVGYFPDGDETLYGYFRNFVFDSNGLLVSVSPETRTTINAPDACP